MTCHAKSTIGRKKKMSSNVEFFELKLIVAIPTYGIGAVSPIDYVTVSHEAQLLDWDEEDLDLVKRVDLVEELCGPDEEDE